VPYQQSSEAYRYWREAFLARADELFAVPGGPAEDAAGETPLTVLTLTIPGEVTEALEKVTAGSQFLLFVTLLTALKIALYRYTRSAVITVGCPPMRDGSGVFADFQVLPLIDRINPKLSFREMLLNLRHTVAEAYKHQDCPIDELSRELEITPNALCRVQVLMALRGFHDEISDQSTAIAMSFERAGREIHGAIRLDHGQVSARIAGRIAKDIARLLASGLQDTRTPVGVLCALMPAEQQQILVEWNRTELKYPNICAHELFEAQAASIPDAIAIVCGDAQVTYGGVNQRSDGLAAELCELGVGPETLVGLSAERSVELIVGLIGILKAGGAYVPLDPVYPAERLRYMMNDARVRVILAGAAAPLGWLGDEVTVVPLEERFGVRELQSRPKARRVAPDNAAYAIYTSGSSGSPKGVCVTHRGVCNLAASQVPAFEISAGSRVLQFASFSFDAAVSEWATAFFAGAKLILPPPNIVLAGTTLAELLQMHEIEVVTLPPSVVAVLPDEPYPALKTLVIAGETCAPELVRNWSAGRRFLNAYGPTETTVCATISAPLQGGDVPIGRPIANTAAYIVDSYGSPVPVGVIGELYVGGAGVARGYLGQPALTAEKFVPDPFSGLPGARLYRTADRIRWLEDGVLEFLGRLDNQVKIRGYRIEIGEIEATLMSHEGVRQCVVLAREDRPRQHRLVAYVVPAITPAPSGTELREYLLQRLPEYMSPAAFVFLEALPLTPNGKVNRERLPAPERATPDRAAVRPRDSVETHLKQLWEEVLNVKNISICDDFFELGGHSLSAVNMTARLTKLYGVTIQVRTLFERPTIERMAEFLRQEVAVSPPSSVVPVQPRGDRRPFFCVHPGGGLVHCFVDLANHLGADQPFYALQSRGFDAGQEPASSIEEMAANYVVEIRAIQPHGPYQIGGLSMGAAVAYEMARQLHEQSETVSLLALLDGSFNPHPPTSSVKSVEEELMAWEREYILNKAREEAGIPRETMSALDFEIMVSSYLAAVQSAGKVPSDVTVKQFRRFLRVYSSNVRALQYYRPRPYAGRITLFQSVIDGESLGTSAWAGLAVSGVEVYSFAGAHGAFIYEPGVSTMAAQLRACMDRPAQAILVSST
jgi:amino acid adenylation domain-containing protein